MVIELEAKEDQFILLSTTIKAWQVVLSSAIGAVKGDNVKYIEVDNLGVPTGEERIGVIRWVSSLDVMFNNNNEVIAYCYMIGEPIGLARISGSLIIG